MELLRDIGRELRGRGDAEQPNDDDRSQEAPDADHHDRRASRTSENATPESRRSPERRDVDRRVTDGAGRDPRDDEHVCDFCRTSFDANRGDCPECGATLVVRGER